VRVRPHTCVGAECKARDLFVIVQIAGFALSKELSTRAAPLPKTFYSAAQALVFFKLTSRVIEWQAGVPRRPSYKLLTR